LDDARRAIFGWRFFDLVLGLRAATLIPWVSQRIYCRFKLTHCRKLEGGGTEGDAGVN
jgi:hypothetical protein